MGTRPGIRTCLDAEGFLLPEEDSRGQMEQDSWLSRAPPFGLEIGWSPRWDPWSPAALEADRRSQVGNDIGPCTANASDVDSHARTPVDAVSPELGPWGSVMMLSRARRSPR